MRIVIYKIISIILFLYATIQIFSFGSHYTSGANLAGIMWALVATLGGIHFWRKSTRSTNKINKLNV